MSDAFLPSPEGKVLLEGLKTLANALKTPVKQAFMVMAAIELTAREFAGGILEIRSTLADWSKSWQFQDILSRTHQGELVPKAEVASSLLPFLTSLDETASEASALRIAEIFFSKIDSSIFESNDALLLDRRSEERAKRSDDKIEHVQSTLENIDRSILDLRERSLQPPNEVADTTRNPQGISEDHATRLDQAKLLLNRGHSSAARAILESLREDLASPTHATTQYTFFRLYTNLGACDLLDGNIADAKGSFVAAAALEPTNPVSSINLARIALIEDDLDRATTLTADAIADDDSRRNPDVIAMRIYALSATGEDGGIQKLVEELPLAQTEPVCILARAEHAFSIEQYDDAVGLVAPFIVGSDINALTSLELTARARIKPLLERRQAGRAPMWTLTSDDRETLKRAITQLDRAIELSERFPRSRSFVFSMRVNRAACHQNLSAHEAAKSDLVAALEVHPDSLDVLQAVVQTELASQQFSSVINRLAERPADRSLRPALNEMLAYAYVEERRYDEAIQTLLRQSRDAEEPLSVVPIDLLPLLVLCYQKAGRIDDVRHVISWARSAYPDHPQVLMLSCQEHLMDGDRDSAVTDAVAALQKSDELPVEGRIRLADLLASVGEFRSAADLYGEYYTRAAPPDLVRNYGRTLYLAGEWGKAEEVAKNARADGIVEPALFRIQAIIYADLGALDDCQDVLRFWLKTVPDTPERAAILADLVASAIRQRKTQEARELLRDLRPHDIDDSRLLFRLADLSRSCGAAQEFDFAYWGWRTGQGNPDAEAAYATFIFSRADEHHPQLEPPERVSPGCAVTLASKGESQTVLIADDFTPRLNGEIGPDSDLAKAIIGKAVGDSAVVTPSNTPSIEYRIKNIETKYFYSFRIVRDEFHFRNASHPGFERYQWDSSDLDATLEPISRRLEERAKYAEYILGQYHSKKLPLLTTGELLGYKAFDILRELIELDNKSIWVARGDPGELQTSVEMLMNVENIVLHYSALLSLSFLSLLDEVRSAFNKLYITQMVLDDLRESGSDPLRSRSYGVLAKTDSGLHYQEVSESSIRQRAETLKQLYEWVVANCTVGIARSCLGLPRADFEKMRQVLGCGTAESAHLSKELRAPLIIDDLATREMLRDGSTPATSNVQALLRALAARGHLPQLQYSTAVHRLISWGYSFITVSDTDIQFVIEQAGLGLPPQLHEALRGLRGPDVNLNGAAAIGANVVYWHRAQGALDASVALLTDAIGIALSEGRNRAMAITAFQAALLKVLDHSDPLTPRLIRGLSLHLRDRL